VGFETASFVVGFFLITIASEFFGGSLLALFGWEKQILA
jgi:hypothetical protein